jgi:hypothetical protein
MPQIRMLNKGEDPLRMEIEPPGPNLWRVFVFSALLLSFGCCLVAAIYVWLI